METAMDDLVGRAREVAMEMSGEGVMLDTLLDEYHLGYADMPGIREIVGNTLDTLDALRARLAVLGEATAAMEDGGDGR